MSLQPKVPYGFSDYLAAERAAIDCKHEYVAGDIFAMAGGSFEHNLIVGNLVRELGNRLSGTPCMALPGDMRVWVDRADAGTYPDVVVLCGSPVFYDDRRDTLTNPALLIEVLSPSAEGYDRGGKFAIYRCLPSLQQYILIAQDRLSVDVYRRQDGNQWLLTAYDKTATEIPFDAIGCTISMAGIYDRVPGFDQ